QCLGRGRESGSPLPLCCALASAIVPRGCSSAFSEPSEQSVDDFGGAALDLDAAAAVKAVFVFQALIGQVGNLDGSRLAKGLEAAGEVDGVAPEVVGKFPPPNDSGDDRAGADADTELDGGVVSGVEL